MRTIRQDFNNFKFGNNTIKPSRQLYSETKTNELDVQIEFRNKFERGLFN